MGLELVELAMDIEDTFGLNIPDADAEVLTTVGQTYEYICKRLGAVKGDYCTTMQIFHRLRRGMVQHLSLDRRDIRPEVIVGELLKPNSKESYRTLGEVTELRLPPLMSRRGLRLVNGSVLLFLTIVAVAPFMIGISIELDAFLSIITVLAAFFWVASFLKKRSWHPQRVFLTEPFSELVRRATTLNKLSAKSTEWTDGRIWTTLKVAIVRSLSVKPEEVVPEARFIQDLGAG